MISFPSIQIETITTIRKDANHNAFTDLCAYAGRFYLAFRRCAEGHGISSTASIVVLESCDGRNWSESFSFFVKNRDTRDPHFLVFRDTLFVYTGTWLQPEAAQPLNLNDHLGFAAYTSDGSTWNGPNQMEGTYGHYVWRAASYGEHAFLCGRRRRASVSGIAGEDEPESIESAMLESTDGLVWSLRSLFVDNFGDETAFLFEADGSALALVRDGGGERARICRSTPALAQWTSVPLNFDLGGPLLTRWGHRYLVGGRKRKSDRMPVISLYWLHENSLYETLELPSAGDCSYPGFVSLNDKRGLLSYYSSHEGSTAVYLAEIATS